MAESWRYIPEPPLRDAPSEYVLNLTASYNLAFTAKQPRFLDLDNMQHNYFGARI